MPKINISMNRSAMNLSLSAARKKEMIVPRIITPDHSDSGNAKAMPIASIYLNGSVGRIGYNMFKQIPYTFTSTKTTAKNYEIYGPLPAGDVVLSVRTPRTRNLLPFPYQGFWQENGDDTWGHYTDSPGKDMVIDSSGVVSAGAGSVSLKYALVLASNMGSADFQPPVIVPAGTYTASIRPGYVSRSSGWRPQMEIRAFRVTDTTYELFNHITDYTGSGYNGRITFTVNEPAIVVMYVFYTSSRNFVADTLYPQLEAGSMTEYEPVNPATLTTITLPRALQEDEYLSFADQKIMPNGTPVTLPALQTLVGENVLMIENYPRLASTIILDL